MPALPPDRPAPERHEVPELEALLPRTIQGLPTATSSIDGAKNLDVHVIMVLLYEKMLEGRRAPARDLEAAYAHVDTASGRADRHFNGYSVVAVRMRGATGDELLATVRPIFQYDASLHGSPGREYLVVANVAFYPQDDVLFVMFHADFHCRPDCEETPPAAEMAADVVADLPRQTGGRPATIVGEECATHAAVPDRVLAEELKDPTHLGVGFDDFRARWDLTMWDVVEETNIPLVPLEVTPVKETESGRSFVMHRLSPDAAIVSLLDRHGNICWLLIGAPLASDPGIAEAHTAWRVAVRVLAPELSPEHADAVIDRLTAGRPPHPGIYRAVDRVASVGRYRLRLVDAPSIGPTLAVTRAPRDP